MSAVNLLKQREHIPDMGIGSSLWVTMRLWERQLSDRSSCKKCCELLFAGNKTIWWTIANIERMTRAVFAVSTSTVKLRKIPRGSDELSNYIARRRWTNHCCPWSSWRRFIMSAATVPHLVEDCKFTHNGRGFACWAVLSMGTRNCGFLFSFWSSPCSLIYQLQAEHTSDHRSYFFNIRYTTWERN